MNPQVNQLSVADVARFDQMTAGFTPVEQAFMDGIPGGLDAFMSAQTTYGNLSLDDVHTREVVATEEGMDALMAPSMTFVSLGAAALAAREMPMMGDPVRQMFDLLDRERHEDDKED